MGPVEILVFVLWLACAAAGWRIGTQKGIDPFLCAGAALVFGPLFLLFLLLLPNFDDYRPRLSRHSEPSTTSQPPRNVVYAEPPAPRPNIEVEAARRLAGLGGSEPTATAPPRTRA